MMIVKLRFVRYSYMSFVVSLSVFCIGRSEKSFISVMLIDIPRIRILYTTNQRFTPYTFIDFFIIVKNGSRNMHFLFPFLPTLHSTNVWGLLKDQGLLLYVRSVR
jgi:hypothetical protein